MCVSSARVLSAHVVVWLEGEVNDIDTSTRVAFECASWLLSMCVTWNFFLHVEAGINAQARQNRNEPIFGTAS